MSDAHDTTRTMREQALVGLNSTLGFELGEATGDRVVMTWTVGPQHLQPFGIVHGGVYCAAIESCASIAGQLWLDGSGVDGHVVGVSNQTDFLRAVGAGAATATATPIHRGRRQQLWLVEVVGDEGKLLARGQVRLQNLETQ